MRCLPVLARIFCFFLPVAVVGAFGETNSPVSMTTTQVSAGPPAMVIGFGYWVLSAFCVSLGHSGGLPPLLAAWLPNSIFAMIGLFFFTAEE